MKRIYLALLLLSLTILSFLTEKSLVTHSDAVLQSFSWNQILGTDLLGRDYFFRILVAIKETFFLSCSAILIAFFMSLVLALFISHLPQVFRSIIMSLVEVLESLPDILLMGVLAVTFLSMMDFPFLGLALSVGIGGIFIFLRYFVNLFLVELAKPYYEAADAIGVPQWRKLKDYIFPNLKGTLIGVLVIHLPQFILIESGLSFLGLGVQPPQATLGNLLFEGWKYFEMRPTLFIAPGFVLIGINLLVYRAVSVKQSEAS